jgi:hypothetical protein
MTDKPDNVLDKVLAVISEELTDEELWNSPLGQRVRTYADKLLLAEGERLDAFHKRQVDRVFSGGVSRARAIVSPLGDPSPMGDGGDPDAVLRPDIDPWANWQSPEVKGLRAAIQETDGSIPAAQERAKQYFAAEEHTGE